MTAANWQQWEVRHDTETTLVARAKGVLPEMESTKQLVQLVAKVYQPGMRVLDVGCNAGHYLRGLRRLDPQLSYTGVDAYPHYIEQARTVFADDPNAAFDVRDVFKPIFPDNPFDIVYCCNVLLHLPDFRQPLRNLLESTKGVCFIRTLLGEYTTVVKRPVTQVFDEQGNPLDFVYQNTWQTEFFVQTVEQLGWKAELIDDEFDPTTLEREYSSVKQGRGTRILGGKQVDGNIIFNWGWVKITKG